MEYELTEKQKKKLERRLTLEDNANLAILEELEELNDNIEELKSKEMPKMEMPEVHKVEVDMKGIELMTLKGEKGDTPSTEELVEIIKPLIPEPKNGKDGKDGKDGMDGKDGVDGLNGKDGVDGKDGKDGSPDTPEQIIEKINSSEEQINKERIKGLGDEIKRIEKIASTKTVSGVSGRDFVFAQDIGSQFDGSTTTFNISGVYMIIAVMLDSYPYGALVEGVHYTYTTTTITFTSELTPATQLGTGQRCKIIAIRI